MLPVSGLDIIITLILFFFLTLGFVYGFIHALGLIVGIVVGLWAANEYFQAVATWAVDTIPFLSGVFSFLTQGMIEVATFVVIGSIIFKLVALAFTGIDHLLRALYVIPFMKSINRLLGAIVGLLEAVVILSLFIHFVNQIQFLKETVAGYMEKSMLAQYLLSVGEKVAPILPNFLNYVISFF